MRNLVGLGIVAVLAVLALSSVAAAQQRVAYGRAQLQQRRLHQGGHSQNAEPAGTRPNPRAHRRLGRTSKCDAGPRSSHDPAGEAAFQLHKPKTLAQPWGGNDPYQVCDPLGFPLIFSPKQ